MRLQFDMRLRGQEVSLNVHVLPPDRSVGIMGFSFEDEILKDMKGSILEWKLSDKEFEAIEDEIARIMENDE